MKRNRRSVSFGVESALADDDSDDERDEDEGSTRSGGSSGGSNVIAANYSGDGIAYPETNPTQWLVREGTDVVISLQGGQDGDVVTATLIHGGTCAADFGACGYQAVIGGSGSIHFMIAQDQLFDEADESFMIMLNVTSGSSTLSQSSFTFTIMQQPEFISDVDYGATSQTANADSYRTCVDSRAGSGTTLTYRRTPINVYSASGNIVRYSLENVATPTVDATLYFQINAATGVISLKRDASEYIRDTLGNYECHFCVRAVNDRYPDMSGGAPEDLADVTVSFSHWNVSRENGFTAAAFPNDGATISMLATSVGLLPGEFQSWLTYNGDTQVELFDGTYKLCRDLYRDDHLAATSFNVFSVPNTFYAAYCFDPAMKNGFVDGQSIFWNFNVYGLQRLGFKVVTFDNSSQNGANAPTALEKKLVFTNTVGALAQCKYLHGLYIVSHGDRDGFIIPVQTEGSSPANNYGWGPNWSMNYGDFNDENDPSDPDSWTVAGALKYHLGALIMHACYSGFTSSVLCSSSVDENSGGLVYALPGSEIADAYVWYIGWDYKIYEDGFAHGGKQSTNRF